MSQSAGQYLVADRSGLAGLIQRAVKERFGSSQRRAARELAGPEATERQVARLQRLINRLVRGETGRITKETVQVLMELVGPERQDEVRQVLLTPAARARLARYRRWMERETARTPGTQHLERQLRGWRLRKRHGKRFEKPLKELFEDFDRFLERIGCTVPRAELAYRDVLAPLMRDAVSGKVERGATELSPTEMRRYLQHAFGVQRVLLSRPLDATRAMEAAWAAEVRDQIGKQVRERERRQADKAAAREKEPANGQTASTR